MPNVSDFYLDHTTGKAYFEMDDGGNKVKDMLSGEPQLCAYSWSEVQTKHDQLVAMGGGELHFVSNATYVVPLNGKVTIDSAFVSLKFNKAIIDVSSYTSGSGTFGVIFHVTSSVDATHLYTKFRSARVIEDGMIVGNTNDYRNGVKSAGPTGFLFHAGTDLTSNRVQFDRMKVVGCYKGLAYGSRSYFVRVGNNCEITRNWVGIFTEPSSEDFAEKNTLTSTVIAENAIGMCSTVGNVGFVTFNTTNNTVELPWHRLLGQAAGTTQARVKFSTTGTLPAGIVAGTEYYVIDSGLTSDSFKISATSNGAAITLSGSPSGIHTLSAQCSGQIFTLNDCSFDYNKQMFVLGNGQKVWNNSANWEQRYGNSVGETLPPITLDNANTAIFGRNLLIYRNKEGLGTDPYYPAFITVNNGAQHVDLEITCARGLGRVTATDADSFVLSTATNPQVRVLFEPDGSAITDVPTMSHYSTDKGIGQVYQGASWSYIAINSLTARTGTANALASNNTDTLATTSVGGNPATVTRKNGQLMTVLQNGTPASSAKYYVTFLCKDACARNAWSFFYNTQAVTGSIIVKEMQATFAAKFDGTTVTWGPAPESPYYANAGGVTLTGASDWRRHSWKDHASSVYPNNRSNSSAAITIEIDMTNATGQLLLSHIGFDTITLSR